ncbi:MAG: DNA mismatch repair protein MutS, partial [Eubacterium sp.]|nr:DNA mismatch repair protein MutS [Eubacterium sp.]
TDIVGDSDSKGDEIVSEMRKKRSEPKPGMYLGIAVLILCINIAAIIVAALGLIKYQMAVIGGALIIGNIISGAAGGRASQLAQIIYSYGVRADDYEKILKAVAEEKFSSGLLGSMTDEIRKDNGILTGFKGLKVIGAMQNLSFNPLFHFVLDGFMGWSLITAYAAARWNDRYSDVLIKAKSIIGSFEELSSLAVLSVVRKTVTPELSESTKPFVKAVEAYHPLITPEKVVANSAEINDKVTVITGSNMSGKTTFLRTIAINMVLGFAGANVCAESFATTYMRIFTSMRVSDDAVNGISTFFAEILRIKEMAEYIKKEQELPAACFIDEIFKGTNSADRIVGAENALTKLSEGNALTMVSTHDFELCDLKDSEGHNVTNHHFEEYYEDDEIRFDYKIKDGRCTTRNAMALLRMAGLS